jgi:hypothetical protein
MGQRLRLSDTKANFISSLTDEQVQQIANLLGNTNGGVNNLQNSIPSVKAKQIIYPSPFLGGDPNNKIIIGDIHAPYILEGYLEFCQEQQKRFNCGTVIFIGDLKDFHASSFHQSNPNLMSAGDEASAADAVLNKAFHMFPNAFVTVGNHDMIPYRKMLASGVASRYNQTWHDIFGAPDTWEFADEFIIDGVKYTHGMGSTTAKANALRSMMPVVQGHLHGQAYVEYMTGTGGTIWGMQVGCGIDVKSAAFDYGKSFLQKPTISCGVVLGDLPIVVKM